jgi:hypothetical protein
MRYIFYFIGGAAVLLGSFVVTLWLTEPQSPSARLKDQRISNYADILRATQEAGLHSSPEMQGNIDAISRINEREVKIEGWLADPGGNSTPSDLLVFVDGSMVVAGKTKGERSDVTNANLLSHGAEKNVSFSLTFSCQPGGKLIVLGVEARKGYFLLQDKDCP